VLKRWGISLTNSAMVGDMNKMSKIKVTQTRGTVGRTSKVRDTLKALGLGRIGKTKEHKVNAALVGMVKKVRHLVEVVELK